MPEPAVSVIVITNRTDEVVSRALASVIAQDAPPLEIVLFGNGAELEPPAELADADGITWVTGGSPENLGVAGGRNAAVKLAGSPYVLLLDDDAIMEPGAIRASLDAITQDGVGAVAFRIVDPDTGRTALQYHGANTAQRGDDFDVDTIIGAGNLIRRDVYDQLDGFWEGYFREMEEVDFSWRLLDAGWRIRYVNGATVRHPERVNRRLYRFAVPSNVAMLWRLFPAGLALRQTIVKVPLFGVRSVRYREFREFAAGVAATPRLVRRARRERATLKPQTLEHLRRLHGTSSIGSRLQWSLRPPR